jgi:hypothetical protein
MLKSATSKVMWLGRATVFVVGLAVILALTVGVVSTALAGSGVGATFNLGKTNTVGAISKLVGSVAGPSLMIDNNSTNSAATALDLQVEAGKAPMKVNSAAKVANLTSDKVDGVDLPLSGSMDVDPPSVGAHSCVQSSVTIPGKLATDSGLLFPSRNFSAGSNFTLTTHAGVGAESADKLFYTVCNVGDTAADPPLGAWSFVIVRVSLG